MRILSPLGFVEIHRKEVAGVVGQQWVDPHRLPACEVVVDDGIRQRDQLSVATVGAFDARLFADAGAPLIGAGRGVA